MKVILPKTSVIMVMARRNKIESPAMMMCLRLMTSISLGRNGNIPRIICQFVNAVYGSVVCDGTEQRFEVMVRLKVIDFGGVVKEVVHIVIRGTNDIESQ